MHSNGRMVKKKGEDRRRIMPGGEGGEEGR